VIVVVRMAGVSDIILQVAVIPVLVHVPVLAVPALALAAEDDFISGSGLCLRGLKVHHEFVDGLV
jgi:hypothetical protein